MVSETKVREVLSAVPYPGLKRDIVSLGLLRSVAVADDEVRVSLSVSSERSDVPGLLRSSVETALKEQGAGRVQVDIVAPSLGRARGKDPWADRAGIPGVAHVVVVGAGKGGVGKSTVAMNLALAFRDKGMSVGLLDADIYGPSIPMLLGLEDGSRDIQVTEERHIVPLKAHGLWVVSFGFFLGPGAPAVWRGPMVAKAVKQFSRGVRWPQVDVLVVDLPPGTGDVPLSLAQNVMVDGAVVVTTPQRLAVQEAERAIQMFDKLGVPILGLVENMSYAECACGRRSHPFGRGGTERLAQETGCPVIGQVPFDGTHVEGGDRGVPAFVTVPSGPAASAFRTMAEVLSEAIQGRARSTGNPRSGG